MIKVTIADDHPIIRNGIKEILSSEPDIRVTGEAKDSIELFNELAKKNTDLLILDINIPFKSGLEVLHDLKNMYPSLQVLMLSIYPESQFALRCLRAGAMGYLNKDIEPEEFLLAIKTIASGKKYITPSLGEKLYQLTENKDQTSPHEKLSDREFDVLRLLWEGKTVTEIAEILSLSVKTISTYKTRLSDKLQLRSLNEITEYVRKHNLFI